MRMFLAALSAAFLLFVSPSLSANGMPQSAPQCFPSKILKDLLKNKYGEYQIAGGMVGAFAIVMYASDKTSTWTIVRFSPRGEACMVAAGVNFNRFERPKPKPEGKPA